MLWSEWLCPVSSFRSYSEVLLWNDAHGGAESNGGQFWSTYRLWIPKCLLVVDSSSLIWGYELKLRRNDWIQEKDSVRFSSKWVDNDGAPKRDSWELIIFCSETLLSFSWFLWLSAPSVLWVTHSRTQHGPWWTWYWGCSSSARSVFKRRLSSKPIVISKQFRFMNAYLPLT